MRVALLTRVRVHEKPIKHLRIERPLLAANEMEAVMLRHPSLAWASLTLSPSGQAQSILLSCTGTPAAIDALVAEYVHDPPSYMDVIDVVERTRSRVVLYEVERSSIGVTDVSGLISKHFGPECAVRLNKDFHGVRWDILTNRDAAVPVFLDELRLAGLAIEKRIGRLVPWYEPTHYGRPKSPTLAGRPAHSADTRLIELALEMGYYEQPKRCSIKDIAVKAGLPPSTAQYRLARAEKKHIIASLEAW